MQSRWAALVHIDDLIEPCPEKIVLPVVSPLPRKDPDAA
jgi:hypothetical protein